MLGVAVSLLALFLPVLFAYTHTCQITDSLKLYGTTVVHILTNVTYSYGVLIYLCCLNMGIVYRLCRTGEMSEDSRIISPNRETSRVAVIVLSVSLTYIVCTVPANVRITLKSTNTMTFANKYIDEIVFTFWRSLFLNHGITFFLYILTSSNFRKTFVSLLTCQ